MLDLVKLRNVDDDFAEAIFRVSIKAVIEVEIENGDWVSDDPVGTWFEPKSAYGAYHDVWATDSNDEIPNAYIIDGENLYEVICEDLINIPEIERLPDGVYQIKCDAAIDVLIENIRILHNVGFEYDPETEIPYASVYDAYDASEANNVVINVYTNHIRISEALVI